MVKPEYKDPTVQQKFEIREALEGVNFNEFGNRILPTRLALKILDYCYGISQNDFFNYSEVEKSEMATEAITKLFFNGVLDKKK